MSKTNWKDTPLLHKVVTIISVLASLSVVVLAILQMFNVWDQAMTKINLTMIGSMPINRISTSKRYSLLLPVFLSR